MNIAPAQPVSFQAVALRQEDGVREQFTRLMSREMTPQQVDEQMREVSQQFVSGAFLQPLLKQMQDDPFRSDLMHGGFAEDSFQQQLNTIIADRIAATPRFPIVDALHDYIMNAYISRGQAAGQVNVHG